jgi:hypothetical protein
MPEMARSRKRFIDPPDRSIIPNIEPGERLPSKMDVHIINPCKLA